ncbi:protein serine/threonine phosphatase [Kluyveromyces lactis]|uniref:RNA polymerase II subunit A C-terminal domain phosphatase n=1 Tax=Kluyveromyces lactis (strain ATCC 8585 / CBS 2359 / DSM 70799 / NBRC 1267 / NRRL Y-1140 / WM37) TaxID=284590 RepID=Q6CSE9_KLULA|nr:uncharacterized protein KLLA0_D01595g [Kluyveromyces lactis]CAH00236.1 KLLA0D01595p [Kluyveromyces lactis]|eukprot:XP_453140.1 uncharacterized protein KLLA0_D01595g [Kluyveromyces lactis]
MSLETNVKVTSDLPYPITVAQLYVKPGDHVEKGQRLFAYEYWDFQDVLVKYEEKTKKQRVDRVATFDSPVSGTVKEWHCSVKDEFASANHEVITIRQDCNHDITYGGLCVQCGNTVDEEDNSKNLTISHVNTNIKVSEQQAETLERSSLTRLREEKKLVLVVDLDQTVIHCGVDPTIGEWMRDPKNPNYKALQDVKSFTLEDEPIIPSFYFGPKPPARKSWYYVKLRPGLKEFFEAVSPHFEMHIYTMATRSYAHEIAKIIDPTGELFGDRILSRDENGSLTTKSLERLFPMDQSMVVVIDDRGDVWNWFENLIKVVPYSFFVGIGDINSNFLPRQQNSVLHLGRHHRRKQEEEKLISDIIDNEKKLKEKIDEEVKRQEEIISHIGDDNTRKEGGPPNKEDISKKLEHSASLEVQQQNRPLAELQKHLHNQTLLIDDDDELPHLSQILLRVHKEYFNQYTEAPKNPPDIKYLLPQMKYKVFQGCHFVFSGLIPLETDVRKADIVLWTDMFGATTSSDINYKTTHIITTTSRTFKARLAKSFNPDIKIVHPDWLFECLVQWERVKESPYELLIQDPVDEDKVKEFKEKLDKKISNPSSSVNPFEDGNEDEEVLGDEFHLLAGNDSWLDNDDDEMDELLNDEDDDAQNDEENEGDEETDEDERPSVKRRKTQLDDTKDFNHSEIPETDGQAENHGVDQSSSEPDEDLEDDLEAELLLELEG